MPPPLIAGLYPYTRNGHRQTPRFTLKEVPASLAANPSYRNDVLVLAGTTSPPHSSRVSDFECTGSSRMLLPRFTGMPPTR